eukprot:TRINITY_DN10732_c0_g1_i1.p2 TRINITY_DN10732_c0_g1~~TRINITY_DN10732_c0_g1_i1.p2  ORF type:complete len:90 (-),score=13.66 TRINITY_DN10732_c0_g1_i1:79-348(-)
MKSPKIESFNERTDLSTVMLLAMITVIEILSVGAPLWWTFREPPELDRPSPEILKTCKKCLNSEEGTDAFEAYLKTEFSVQHIYFWQDC